MKSGSSWDFSILWNLSDTQALVYNNTYIQVPVDNPERYYPDCDHFMFQDPETTNINSFINQGLTEFYQGDFDESIAIMKQIVEDYPDSTQTELAIEYLYLITRAGNKDYTSLKNYLDLQIPEENLELYVKKENIKTKCNVSEGDYTTAINRLQLIIDNPETAADSLFALLDQAYCYLNLAEQNPKNLPNISIDTRDFISYLDFMSRLKGLNELTSSSNNKPHKLVMESNYPNPFNPSTTISFNVPKDAKVKLSIYNIKGQKVKTLLNESMTSGKHTVMWDGKNSFGKQVSSGVYFARVEQSGKSAIRKMLLMK